MKCFLACLLLASMLLPLSALADGYALYVSPDGSDESPGTADAPLASLAAAVSRVRKDAPAGGAAVYLHGGTYVLEETLTLTHRDRKDIAFAAVAGETPVISGGVPVTGWTVGEWLGKPIWTAQVSYKQLCALYNEEGARPSARWPKFGVLLVKDTLKKDAARPSNETQAQHRAFYAYPEDIGISLDGAVMRMLHLWKDELAGVTSYDAVTGRVVLSRRTSMTVRPLDPYWFENVLGAPLDPGEWAFDAAARTVYYAPRNGETPENTALYAGVLERLITMDGAAGRISFEGITFTRTGWTLPGSGIDFPQAAYDVDAAVYARNVKGLTFTHCTFRDTGAGCIRLDYNVKDVTIERCTFENIGAQAVYIRGRNLPGDASVTERLSIRNNRIAGYGQNFRNAPAILLMHAGDCDIAHNEISDGYYTAISGGWVWGAGTSATHDLRITNNLIHDIGRGMLSDMGGIYLLGTQRGTVVSGNIIHDVHAAEYGGWGIYLDEGAGRITVENNLVYSCSDQGFFQHRGVENTVRNNIFAYSLQGQIGTSDKTGNGTFHLQSNLLAGEEPFFYRKYGKEKMDVGANLYYAEASPFADAIQGDYTLLETGDFSGAGFVPWVYDAGVQAE